MADAPWTPEPDPVFDFASYPEDTCFHDRRSGTDRRTPAPDGTPTDAPTGASRTPRPARRPDRRRRVDPTTFEKQYSPAEVEFMNAVQRYKVRTGRAFPSYREVLQIALELGYRRDPLDVPADGSAATGTDVGAAPTDEPGGDPARP